MEQQQQLWKDRRPDALGDLRVLPDELLCFILEHLEPSDLSRLACVSSVMYILCNEEPLWMTLCLREGGLLEYKGTWKRTWLFRKGVQPDFSSSCKKVLQFDGFYSLFLHRRWYRCNTTLDGYTFDTGIMERRENVTIEDFHSQYDGLKPVLLTDLAKNWPARTRWTMDQLLQNYGDVAFRISQRSSKKVTMKFKDYFSYMQLQHDEDPLYIFDDKFGEAAPALLKDYLVPHLFQEDFLDVLDHDQRPPFRWLIIGPERSGASWHVDPALTSAWNTLLCGRKRWALYPPGRVPVGVTVHVNEEDGDINIESPSSLQWWLDIYPYLADQDKPIECTQLPGETIFVPSGWWHCVLNLETTVAVTQNFVNRRNFQFVCLDLAPGHRHKGVCRAGFLAVQDSGGEKSKENASFQTNHFNYSNMTRKEKRLRVTNYDTSPNDHDLRADEGLLDTEKKLLDEEFSYDIDFLAKFLDDDRDHYISIWSPSNCIGQREMRGWLHKLWVARPDMRPLIWKGACVALNADKWLACAREVCAYHNLPSPSDDEKLPVGTGSNPVFLVSDYVIKIYVEGGLESSVHGMGTELEFYSLLHKVASPLKDYVPEILASGIIFLEDDTYRIQIWDGRGVPDVIANSGLVKVDEPLDDFPFGVWSKKQFELNTTGAASHARIWPYLVIRRCKGSIFANVRDELSIDDALHLASFLGDQLRSLHLLPVPHLMKRIHSGVNKMSLTSGKLNGLVECTKISVANGSMEVHNNSLIPLEWKPIFAVMEKKRRDLSIRLSQWGDPIPKFLADKVEEYVPHDLSLLLDLFKDEDGQSKATRSPTWVHTDIMDDNIYMESCTPSHLSNESCPSTCSTNGEVDQSHVKIILRKWKPTHILDFSDLTIGDPLYDLIPIYLDVFRGDITLLKQLLNSYNLPLAMTASNYKPPSQGLPENEKKLCRISYRAMCYCILHEDNILGAIFSLWKELRSAHTWEEVEEAVWGELNSYQ